MTNPITTIHGNCYEGMTREDAEKKGVFNTSKFYMAFEEIDVGYKDENGNIVGQSDGILQRQEIINARKKEYKTRSKICRSVYITSGGALGLSLRSIFVSGGASTVPAVISAVGFGLVGLAGLGASAYYDHENKKTLQFEQTI